MGLDAIKKAENLLNNPRDLFLFYVKESVRAGIKSNKEILIYLVNNFQTFLYNKSSEIDCSLFSIFDTSIFSFISYKLNKLTNYSINVEFFIPKDALPIQIISAYKDELNSLNEELNNAKDDSKFDLFGRDTVEIELELAEKKEMLFGRGLRCHSDKIYKDLEYYKKCTDYLNYEEPVFEIEIKMSKYKINDNLPQYFYNQIGKILSKRVLCYWLEDFVDEDTGEVVTIERSEMLFPKETLLTESDLKEIYEKINHPRNFPYIYNRSIWIYDDVRMAYFKKLNKHFHAFGMDYIIKEYISKFDFFNEKDWRIIKMLFYELIICDKPDAMELLLEHLFFRVKNTDVVLSNEVFRNESSIIYWIDYLMNACRDEIVHYIIEVLHEKKIEDIDFDLQSFHKSIAYIFITCYYDDGLLFLKHKCGISDSQLNELKLFYMINEDNYRYIDELVFNIN